jgi:4-hydroxybenzoate polyprenyltransferase
MAQGKAYFRANDWWQGKAALLMGLVYLFTCWFSIPFTQFLQLGGLSLMTISGFASLGYLLNDLFDLKKDALAGKPNSLESKSAPIIIVLFSIAATLMLLPWKFLPWNTNSLIMIGAEVGLFLIYSVPPIRLKDRGLAGIIADATYAHSLPLLLAGYTFSLAANYKLTALPVGLLLLWQTASGTRNILIHQFEDEANDKKSDTRGFYSSLSFQSFQLLIKLCVALEFATSISFFILLSPGQSLFFICGAVLLLFLLFAVIRFGLKSANWLNMEGWHYFPNPVFEKWIPAAILVILSFADIRFIFILVLNTILFNYKVFVEAYNRLFVPSRDFTKETSVATRDETRKWLSYVVNNFIYYLFLLFGIDLKKENLSAMDYLRRGKKTKQG